MRWKRLISCLVLPVSLLMGTAAHGSIWVTDFSTMTGTNEYAVAPYTDEVGLQPNQYSVTYSISPGNSPWLYKTAEDTVMFDNVADGVGGRARFSTAPQSSFNIYDGVSVAYRYRVGAVNGAPRSQFGIRVQGDGSELGWGAWIRLRNSDFGAGTVGYIDIGRENHDDSYHDRFYLDGDERGIKQLVLDEDKTNVWVEITLVGIYNPDDTSAGRKWSYWQFYLDGQLVQFEGKAGATGTESEMIPDWNGQQWSFRLSNLSGGSDNRLQMMHLGNVDVWTSEFDCVAYQDEAEPVSCELEGLAVSPGYQSATAPRGEPAVPASITYTIRNWEEVAVDYEVETTDELGAPASYAWLSLDKSGGTIPAGDTDTVVASIIDTDMPGGTYTAYVTFTDDSVPPELLIRQIDLEIVECESSVDQAAGVARTYRAGVGDPLPDDAVFTITNEGSTSIDYTVEKVTGDPCVEDGDCAAGEFCNIDDVCECAWLSLDKAGGTLPGLDATDQVTAQFNETAVLALDPGVYSCQIKFTDDCNPAVEHFRTVTLTVNPPPVTWTADFTAWDEQSGLGWIGQDLGAQYRYYNPQNPGTPLVFSILYNQNVDGAVGWLTQGVRGGVIPTTAKFLHPVTGSGNGRARFGTDMPASMILNPDYGLSFAWKSRYGDYAMTRAPVQLNVRDHLGRTQRPFFRVQNGTQMRILRNGGAAWGGIDELTLPINVAVPQAYHDWSVSVVMDAQNTTLWHWKVWLNGELLSFGGDNGDHFYDGQWWSFLTYYPDGDGTSSEPNQFRLGELWTVSTWDFEFDCIAYRDDLNDGEPLYCMPGVEYCGAAVSPSDVQSSSAYWSDPAVPESITYQVANYESQAVDVKVEVSYDAGNPGSSTGWLELNVDEGVWYPAAPGDSADVVATITDTELAVGTHTAYLTFTDTCAPANQIVRQIDLDIVGCLGRVEPVSDIYRTVDVAEPVVDDVVLTFTNVVGTEYYTVEKLDVCDWLILDKTGMQGPVPHGQSDSVTGEIDPDGLATGLYSCQIKFTDDCAVEQIRTVHLSLRDGNYLAHWYAAEFMGETGRDWSFSSPMVSFPNEVPVANFNFVNYAGPGAPPDGTDFLTQGLIGTFPRTAKFYWDWFAAYRVQIETRDLTTGERQLPLRADVYDPSKGLAWVWRQKLGDYVAKGTDPRRGPAQLILPTAAGQETDGRYSAGVPCHNAYIQILRDTISGSGDNIREIRILRNGGAPYGGISPYLLPQSLVNEYHVWSASAVYDASFDAGNAYWNLWVGSHQVMFGGPDGSVEGPGGKLYSFRTGESFSGAPYVRLGETSNDGTTWFCDMEFDYVRVITLDVAGAPYWDGNGWGPEIPPALCPPVWADANRDGVIDQQDFAYFQACYTGVGDPSQVFNEGSICVCFDRDGGTPPDVDGDDLAAFEACAAYSGPGVPYDAETIDPACLTNPPSP